MADVGVTRSGETEDVYTFDVVVTGDGSTSRHAVTLSRADYEAQGDRWSDPEALVSRSFEFLLEREPKESILSRFDLRDIGRYFPAFDRDVLHAEG